MCFDEKDLPGLLKRGIDRCLVNPEFLFQIEEGLGRKPVFTLQERALPGQDASRRAQRSLLYAEFFAR
jgi:hypothetical protein